MKQKVLFPVLGLGALAFGAVLLFMLRLIDPRTAQALTPIAQLPDFTLVDQTGAPFTKGSLAKSGVWVADFIFTSCQGTCPVLTSQMKKLVARTPREVRFISFTVDPERDTPAVLAAYAAKIPADPARWSFVTGEAAQVRDAVVGGFKMTAEKVKNGAGDYDVVHGSWFVLVDSSGKIRGYYHVDSDDELEVLAHDAASLSHGSERLMTAAEAGDSLALVNAILNGTAAALLLSGRVAVAKKKVTTHRALMVAAFVASCVFLISYLTRVALTGAHDDPHKGAFHVLYLVVLFSHMVLAIVVVPLVLRTLWLARKKRFASHRKIARFTFPVWLYVSVTGVAVYVMLYHVPA